MNMNQMSDRIQIGYAINMCMRHASNKREGERRGEEEANQLSLRQNPNPGRHCCCGAVIVASLLRHHCCGTLTLACIIVTKPMSSPHCCHLRALRGKRGEEDWKEKRERERGV